MRTPVCPTWSVWGRHPRLVTTREHPTTPPRSSASSSSGPNPSGPPTPRPPPTTTRASGSEIVPRAPLVSAHLHSEVGVLEFRRELLDGPAAGREPFLGPDGVGGDRQQPDLPVQTGILEEAAAPSEPRDQVWRARLARLHVGAVGGHRGGRAGAEVGHDLGAPVGPG